MWLFAGGPPDEFVYYYRYHYSRSHEVATTFLEDFAGFVHCDGYLECICSLLEAKAARIWAVFKRALILVKNSL